MRKFSAPLWATLSLVFAVALGACGTTTPSTPPGPTAAPKAALTTAAAPATTAAAPAAPATTAPATTAAPAATAVPSKAVVKQEGDLRVAAPTLGRDVMNPLVAGGDFPGASLFDHLLWYGPDGTSVGPGVAESWQGSADGLTWTFKIRKGIKFHNGDDLTAEDVRFSLLAFSQKVQGAPAVTTGNAAKLKALVKDIQVVDPYTVRVTTNDPADLPFFVTPLYASEGTIMPKNYIEKVGWDEFNRKPIGSGPWRLVEYKSGNYVKYEALPEHWRVVPVFKTLTYFAVPEVGSRVAMLRAGEADVASVPPTMAKEVEGFGLSVSRMAGQVHAAVWIPLDRSNAKPTANVKVREALSLAIDRDEMIKYIAGGEAVYPAYPAGIFADSVGVDLKALPKPQSDATKAKQLLAEAGLANGFTVDLHASSGGGFAPDELGRVLAAQWQKLGIKANVFPTDLAAAMTGLRMNPPDAKFQGAVVLGSSISAGIPVPDRMPYFYDSKMTNGLHLLNSPELDSAMAAALAEKDLTKRAALATQNAIAADKQFVNIPIMAANVTIATSKKIQLGVRRSGTYGNTYSNELITKRP